MALSLFMADKLRADVLMRVKHKNITFVTSKKEIKTQNSPILALLSQLSYTPDAIYTDLTDAQASLLQTQEIGVGALFTYALSHNITHTTLADEIEIVSYSV